MLNDESPDKLDSGLDVRSCTFIGGETAKLLKKPLFGTVCTVLLGSAMGNRDVGSRRQHAAHGGPDLATIEDDESLEVRGSGGGSKFFSEDEEIGSTGCILLHDAHGAQFSKFSNIFILIVVSCENERFATNLHFMRKDNAVAKWQQRPKGNNRP